MSAGRAGVKVSGSHTPFDRNGIKLNKSVGEVLKSDEPGIAREVERVQVYFHNGDVAHVRPSGNASQLRIYANSDSQARADRIVELGLREPDGILRQMDRAFI